MVNRVKLILVVIFLLPLTGNAQKNKERKEMNEYRFFDLSASYIGTLTTDDNNGASGFNIGFGYELKYPKFEYIGVRPTVGFTYLRHYSEKINFETDSHISKFKMKLYHTGFNFGVAANLYLPFDSGSLESIYLGNEFNWMIARYRIRLPDYGKGSSFDKTSNLNFYYNIKLGVKFYQREERMRVGFWVGVSSLSLDYQVRKIVPDDVRVSDIDALFTIGFNVNF